MSSHQLASRPRPSKTRPAETVRRLVDAALTELRANGYDALTVRAVAGRTGVAPATAYTYFSSKPHLVAETFWRSLQRRPQVATGLGSSLAQVTAVFRDLAEFMSSQPELSAATTVAMLAPDPDVSRLRRLVAEEIQARLSAALGDDLRLDVLEALGLAWSGSMLQAGMGHMTYEQMGEQLQRVARVVMGERS